MPQDPYTLSPVDRLTFQNLQDQLPPQFKNQFPDPLASKTVVIIPSLSMDAEILAKISGHIHYEERLLCLLLLLRMPRTRVIYVTSTPIEEVIVDYYLHLIPGVTSMHARSRLTLLSCYDSSNKALTAKILAKPRLVAQIKSLLPEDHVAHISAFNVTPLEERLALELGIPLYGCPSDLSHWGNKTGGRNIFKNSGVPVPPGFENIFTKANLVQALEDLKTIQPAIRKAVLKLNEGFSGDGNAIYTYDHKQTISVENIHQHIKTVATDMEIDLFFEKMSEMGGVLEAFVEGEIKTSPSVQCVINPLQEIEIVSTHDQILGGESGQVYLGACFPADPEYRKEIGALGHKVASYMANLGVLGRFGVDFVSIKKEGIWEHYAIEINLRKGGTTHPYLMLQLLTNGRYDYLTGEYIMPNGQTRYYMATDAMVFENFKKLTPSDLIDVAICNGLHFDGSTQEGVMFHLIGAIAEHGKLGILSIGSSPDRAEKIYHKTTALLLKETE